MSRLILICSVLVLLCGCGVPEKTGTTNASARNEPAGQLETLIGTELVATIKNAESLAFHDNNLLIFNKPAKQTGFMATDWMGRKLWNIDISGASFEQFSNELFMLKFENDGKSYVSFHKISDGMVVFRLVNDFPDQSITDKGISKIITEQGDEYHWGNNLDDCLFVTNGSASVIHKKSKPVLAGSNINGDPYAMLQAMIDGKVSWETRIDKRLLPIVSKSKLNDVDFSFGELEDFTLLEYSSPDINHKVKGLLRIDNKGQTQWISNIPPILSYCVSDGRIVALTATVENGFYTGETSLWVLDYKTGQDIAFVKDFKHNGDIVEHSGSTFCIAGNTGEMEIIKINLTSK